MNRRTFLKSVLAGLFTLLVPQVQVEAQEETVGPSLIQNAAPEFWRQFKTKEWLDRVERDNEWYRRVTSEPILCIDQGKDGYDMTAVVLFSKDSNGIMTLEDLCVSHYEDEIAEFISSLPCDVNVVVSGQCVRHGGRS